MEASQEPVNEEEKPPNQGEQLPNQYVEPPIQQEQPPNRDEEPPNQDEEPPNQDKEPPNQDEEPPNQDEQLINVEEELQDQVEEKPPEPELDVERVGLISSFIIERMSKIKVNWDAYILSAGKKGVAVTKLMAEFYNCSLNPYDSAVKGMAISGDLFTSKQTTLAYFVMDYFLYWKKYYVGMQLPPPSRNLKIEAFRLVTHQKNLNLTQCVIEAFELKEDKLYLVDQLKQVGRNGMYKEACLTAIMLKLYDCFTIEDFVIPLLFQDKYNIAQEFLERSEAHQMEMTLYLDKLLGMRNFKTEVHRICRALSIKEPKLEKFSFKSTAKLLKRIIIGYNISPDCCPNLTRKKNIGALQFLLRKRFCERTIGLESWTEMVEEAVGNDRYLQYELVCGIATYGVMDEAYAWADKYHISKSKVVPRRNIPKREPKPEETNVIYHTLSLDRSQIFIIDTKTDFGCFIDSALDGVRTCGFDCEWKPTMGFRKSILALIQIATRHAAFIIDVWKLLNKVPSEMWIAFTDKIFHNRNLLKIGFAFNSDFSIIQDTLPWVSGTNPSNHGFLDLLPVWRRLVHGYNFRFPYADQATTQPTSESLNRLVELTTGGRLDKSDQFSNWEKRPLRERQVIYAALDAFCLIEVYDVLELNCAYQNIPFDEVVIYALEHRPPAHKRNRKKKKSSA